MGIKYKKDRNFGVISFKLSQLEEKIQNKKQLNSEIGQKIKSQTTQRFFDQKNPDGSKWKKSIRAENEGGSTLTKSTTLRNSIGFDVTDKETIIGTNNEYSAVHQFGAIIKAIKARYLKFKIGNRFTRKEKVKTPKREYLGISNQNAKEILELIDDYMEV